MSLVFNNWVLAMVIVGRYQPLSVTTLSKRLDCTYSSLATTTKELESKGLLNRKKTGRIISLTLTNKGTTVYRAIETIIEHLPVTNYQGVEINKWRITNPNDATRPSGTELDALKQQHS